MSERAPKTPEQGKDQEKGHESDKTKERLQETIEAGKQAKHEAKDSLETIRSSIEKEARKTKEAKQKEAEEGQDDKGPGQVTLDRTVKGKAYKKELQRVRSHLPKTQKAFSKVIHNRTVEAVSEVGGKTVARPSGLLGGGIVAFVGTATLVLVSRHYGFTYNFFVYLALLASGFLIGLIAELIIRGVRKNK